MHRDDPLSAVGRWVTRATATSPWTNVYGLARSLLALATLLTLTFNSTTTLFPPASGVLAAPHCEGLSRISVYCVAPGLEAGRWISIVVLVAVVVGIVPRWTAVPHWYVAFSLQSSATTLDGGDQVAAVMSLLLIPVALCDGRRWHWNRPTIGAPDEAERVGRLIAVVGLTAIRVQAFVIYFQAGMSKFGVREWADGTAMYYWLTDGTFGAPPWLAWMFAPVLDHGGLLALFTWSMMAGEVVLAAALFAPRRTWKYFLIGAIAFHVGIALVIGLVSFAMSMIALDIVFLHVADKPIRALGRIGRSRTPQSTAVVETGVAPTVGATST